MRFLGLEHEVGKNNNALETWYGSAKCEVAPEMEIQKNKIEPTFNKKLTDINLLI